jgi:hypothetical protein
MLPRIGVTRAQYPGDMTPRQRKEGREEILGTSDNGRAPLQHRAATASFAPVNLLLTIHIHLAHGAGARWSNGMSGHEVQADANLLSAFALMIGGALGVALPMTIVIIWICS